MPARVSSFSRGCMPKYQRLAYYRNIGLHRLGRKSKNMAVPKSKITKSKRNMRRAHDALTADAYVEDKVTGELHRPHHIDLKTGMYRGKQILKVKDRI